MNKLLIQLLILIIGLISASTAVIFIKFCTVHPILLAAYRLLCAALFLSPLFFRDVRKFGYKRKDFIITLLPGILLGIHFITWIKGARMTPVANATLIVTMVPLVTPFFLALIKEKLTKLEVSATAVALVGIIWLGYSDFNINVEYLKGDLVCFISMLLLAVYLVLARKNRTIASIWLYVVPLYSIAGIFCLITAVVLGVPFEKVSLSNIVYILCITLIPTIMGHTAINNAMKYFRGQIVSVLTMIEFVIATCLGYIFLAEVPHKSFYLAALLASFSGVLMIIDAVKSKEGQQAVIRYRSQSKK